MLTAPDSDVSVEVAKGVKTVITQHIYTDFQAIKTVISPTECIVSPIVRLHVQDEAEDIVASHFKFKVRIPHCLTKQTDFAHLKVRCGDMNIPNSLKKMNGEKHGSPTMPYYELYGKYIILYTDHFCDVFCSSEQKICNSSLTIMPFGSLDYDKNDQQTRVKVKVILCSILYNMTDKLMVGGAFSLCNCDIIEAFSKSILSFLSLDLICA